MLLSGSVGYTLLENLKINKKVLILADVHDGVSYCERDSVMIDSWLASKTPTNDILLEEIVREEFKLGDLWPSSVHTRRLKELNQKNQKIIPIDIRPLLIPFSWELLETDARNEIANMTLNNYLMGIDNLFNYRSSKLMKLYIAPQVKKLHQNSDDKIKIILLNHFEEMKQLYIDYRQRNKDYMDKTISEIFRLKPLILEEINNMISMIMEWYILLLVLNSKTNSILHLGLAHSNRVLDFLIEIYQFKTLKTNGVNKISEIINTSNEPKSCLLLPEDIK